MSGRRNGSGEDGQVLIILATAFFFVFVGAAAMTIDLGNGMLQQRRLQNATDAAAVAAAADLSRGDTPSNAAAIAQSVVNSNYGAVNLTYYPTGTQGVNLTNGIEINGDEVRVAAQTPVKTFLAGVIGVKTFTVSARSRAGEKFQGVLPVAVKRFSAGDTSIPLSTGNGNSTPNPRNGDAYDYIAYGGDNPLLNWPSPLSASAGQDQLQNGSGSSNPVAAADPGPSDICDPSIAGPVFPFLGRHALANVANGNDFHFWIAPDIRNITSPSPEYYNNVQALTSAQQLKNQESGYIVSGYPSSPPVVGDQVAIFSGTNTSNTVQLMQETYPRGSYVTAMVYNGTVYRKADFNLNVTPSWTGNALNGGDQSNGATFPIQLTRINGFSDAVSLSVVAPPHWNWQLSNTTLSGGPSDSSVLTVWPDTTLAPTTPSNQPFSGTATFEVIGSSPNVTKSGEATVVAGSKKYYSLSSQVPYQVVAQGSYTQFDLGAISWNSYSGNVSLSGWSWVGSAPSGTVTVTTDTSVATVKNNKPGALEVYVNVGSDASVGQYTLLVTANDGTGSQNASQSVYLTLQIIPPITATNITNTTGYVNILGYANFQITYYNNASSPGSKDNNTIYACAVSDIVSDPDQLNKGMIPRLLPWR